MTDQLKNMVAGSLAREEPWYVAHIWLIYRICQVVAHKSLERAHRCIVMAITE